MKTAISKRILCVALAMVLCFAVIGAHGVTPARAAGSQTYEKVTSAPDDWSGTYLIVYEGGSLAFDGSRTTLDAEKNTVGVTISDSKITGDYSAYTFTIASVTGGYTIKSASGFYIGNNSNSNALSASDSTALTNTITLTGGNVNIKSSGGAYLRYNKTSGQERFRYFKSATYTSQQAISLYKYVEPGSSDIDTSNLKITWDQCKLVLDVFPQINFYLQVENPDKCMINGTGYQIWPKGEETEPVIPDVNPETLIAGAFKTDGNDTYVTTGGLNVNQITDCYWIRAYVKIGDKYIWTDVKEYSVYYYQKCLAAWPDLDKCGNYQTKDVKATVSAFIAYGEAAAEMHKNAAN